MIKVLFLDVDGVLTDGRVILGKSEEFRNFSVLDGLGVHLAKEAGLNVILISGKTCDATQMRALELGVEAHQGISDKAGLVKKILKAKGIRPDEAAFMGDDLLDVRAMKFVGLPIAVKNAVPEVKQAAKKVTSLKGGRGAVREAIEIILREDGRWQKVIAQYM